MMYEEQTKPNSSVKIIYFSPIFHLIVVSSKGKLYFQYKQTCICTVQRRTKRTIGNGEKINNNLQLHWIAPGKLLLFIVMYYTYIVWSWSRSFILWGRKDTPKNGARQCMDIGSDRWMFIAHCHDKMGTFILRLW
jgi:hypothetical protein